MYLCYGRSGTAYLVKSSYSHLACAKIEKQFGDVVSCWFIGKKIPENAVIIE
jgi:hypothetical protein